MPGVEGQIYGSETTAGGHENAVASNQLDGLQWGKSGLEMDEERKQQVVLLILIIMIGFIESNTFSLISIRMIFLRSIHRLLTSTFVGLKKHDYGFQSALMKSFLPLEKVFLKILYAMEFI